MVIRLRYRVRGGHVHCRLFTAKAKMTTFAKCGELVFSIEEWGTVREEFWRVMDVLPEEDAGAGSEPVPEGGGVKRKQVLVRGRLRDGSIGNIDVLDLDGPSFRAFVLDVLYRAELVAGIRDEHVDGDRILYVQRKPETEP